MSGNTVQTSALALNEHLSEKSRSAREEEEDMLRTRTLGDFTMTMQMGDVGSGAIWMTRTERRTISMISSSRHTNLLFEPSNENTHSKCF